MSSLTLSEKEWQARYDAKSLALAEEIKADSVRYNAAQNAAVKVAEEKRKELDGINRVAKRKNLKETAQKTPLSTENNRVKELVKESNVAERSNKPNKFNKPKTMKRSKKAKKATVQNNNFNVFKKI